MFSETNSEQYSLARPQADSVDYAGHMLERELHDRAELVALLRERPRGLGWTELAGLVLECGSAGAARDRTKEDTLFGSDEETDSLATALDDVVRWQAQGLGFWSIVDEMYPSRVRDIQEAPPFLFSKGRLVHDDLAVSVVGSRKASPTGLQLATKISEALVSRNLTVSAGLAAGIDTAAHEAALRLGGRTVAFLGTGIHQHYPASNRALQDRIASDGLLLSQFWPDAPPRRQSFPMRNAVMSGYGIATVVVEAGEHSGARIQARLAVHHGRPVILTDLVLRNTKWGPALLDKPDVYPAGSIDEVMSHVDALVSRPARLRSALDQIAV